MRRYVMQTFEAGPSSYGNWYRIVSVTSMDTIREVKVVDAHSSNVEIDLGKFGIHRDEIFTAATSKVGMRDLKAEARRIMAKVPKNVMVATERIDEVATNWLKGE